MSHYNVNPRYTSGSPAMVDAETAERVAAEEREAYSTHITGIYGEPRRAMADREGLKGIVEHVLGEERRDRMDGFRVRDLLTDETFWRPSKTGSGEPACRLSDEHRPDPESLRLVALPNANDESALGVVVTVSCKLCGRLASTKPLNIFWPEEREDPIDGWSLPGDRR